MESVATNNPLLKIGFLIYMLGTLISCGDYISQYSENDGAYYDPESDTLPRYVDITSNNQVGNIYQYDYDNEYNSYNKNTSELTTEENADSIVSKAKQNEQKQQNKYQNWGKNDTSDWGKYVGTKVYISNYYVNPWRHPYYSWYRWDYPHYGWYNPYDTGFGWRSYHSWGYYDPFWGWSYYPYYPTYRHRVIRHRSVPKYKERGADSVDRSKYYGNKNQYKNSNYNDNVYNAGATYKDRNNDGNSSRNSGKAVGNSGGGFRR